MEFLLKLVLILNLAILGSSQNATEVTQLSSTSSQPPTEEPTAVNITSNVSTSGQPETPTNVTLPLATTVVVGEVSSCAGEISCFELTTTYQDTFTLTFNLTENKTYDLVEAVNGVIPDNNFEFYCVKSEEDEIVNVVVAVVDSQNPTIDYCQQFKAKINKSEILKDCSNVTQCETLFWRHVTLWIVLISVAGALLIIGVIAMNVYFWRKKHTGSFKRYSGNQMKSNCKNGKKGHANPCVTLADEKNSKKSPKKSAPPAPIPEEKEVVTTEYSNEHLYHGIANPYDTAITPFGEVNPSLTPTGEENEVENTKM